MSQSWRHTLLHPALATPKHHSRANSTYLRGIQPNSQHSHLKTPVMWYLLIVMKHPPASSISLSWPGSLCHAPGGCLSYFLRKTQQLELSKFNPSSTLLVQCRMGTNTDKCRGDGLCIWWESGGVVGAECCDIYDSLLSRRNYSPRHRNNIQYTHWL